MEFTDVELAMPDALLVALVVALVGLDEEVVVLAKVFTEIPKLEEKSVAPAGAAAGVRVLQVAVTEDSALAAERRAIAENN